MLKFEQKVKKFEQNYNLVKLDQELKKEKVLKRYKI